MFTLHRCTVAVLLLSGCGEGAGDAEPGLCGQPIQQPPRAGPAQGGRGHPRRDQGGEGIL